MSSPSQPQRLRRTRRDDAPPPPAARVVMHRPITLDGMTPVDAPADGRFAPESYISLQDIPSMDHVALVARDRSGRVRFRLEVENDERVIRWFTKALRFGLVLFYGSCSIQLVN